MKDSLLSSPKMSMCTVGRDVLALADGRNETRQLNAISEAKSQGQRKGTRHESNSIRYIEVFFHAVRVYERNRWCHGARRKSKDGGAWGSTWSLLFSVLFCNIRRLEVISLLSFLCGEGICTRKTQTNYKDGSESLHFESKVSEWPLSKASSSKLLGDWMWFVISRGNSFTITDSGSERMIWQYARGVSDFDRDDDRANILKKSLIMEKASVGPLEIEVDWIRHRMALYDESRSIEYQIS